MRLILNPIILALILYEETASFTSVGRIISSSNTAHRCITFVTSKNNKCLYANKGSSDESSFNIQPKYFPFIHKAGSPINGDEKAQNNVEDMKLEGNNVEQSVGIDGAFVEKEKEGKHEIKGSEVALQQSVEIKENKTATEPVAETKDDETPVEDRENEPTSSTDVTEEKNINIPPVIARLSDSMVTSVKTNEPIKLSTFLNSENDKTMLVFGTYSEDFNVKENVQSFKHHLSRLKEKGVGKIGLVLDCEADTAKLLVNKLKLKTNATVSSDDDNDTIVNLFSDPKGEAGRKFGIWKGWKPEDEEKSPYVKLIGMLWGLGAWATLPAVIGGYVGPTFFGQPWIDNTLPNDQKKGRLLLSAALELDEESGAVKVHKLTELSYAGDWENHPLEPITLHLQNILDVSIKNWKELVLKEDHALFESEEVSSQTGKCCHDKTEMISNDVPDKLLSSLERGFKTVRRWESEDLHLACRELIPFGEICPEHFHHGEENLGAKSLNPYAKPDDHMYSGVDLFLKRLALYFKQSMTWVSNPKCETCGSNETKYRSTRPPLTPEEQDGEASRVEVYFCPKCNAETTTFPRYNSPKKLLETRKGRCGEYANLFGSVCRSVGLETRYILDFTDHVWVEVWSNETSRWIMADGCEGVIDEPSMYEEGWGKDLSYNLAFTIDSVADVTRRYTRKFNSDQFQARRRKYSPNENQSDTIIAQYNASVRARSNLTDSREKEFDKREQREKQFFENTLKQKYWGDGTYSEGRLSGSLDWKLSRGETGNHQCIDLKNDKASEADSQFLHIDDFHPLPFKNEDYSTVVSGPPAL